MATSNRTGSRARRLRIGLTATLLVAAIVVLTGPTAQACSCVGQTDDQALFEMPVVFVGTPVAFAPADVDGFLDRRVTFAVESTLRGDIDTQAEVFVDHQSDCGTPSWGEGDQPVDRRVVAVAWLDSDGRAVNGGCAAEPSVDYLEEVLASALPPPSGNPIVALVPVRERWAAVAGLDADGSIAAWGAGVAPRTQIAGCPDASAALETTVDGITWLRDSETMNTELAWRALPDERGGRVVCVSAANGPTQAVTIRGGLGARGEPLTVTRVDGGEVRTMAEFAGFGSALVDAQRNRIFLLPRQPGSVEAVDLDTLESVGPQTTGAPGVGATLSPDGSSLAVVVTDGTRATAQAPRAAIEIHAIGEFGFSLMDTISFVDETGRFEAVHWSPSGVLALEIRKGNSQRLVRVRIDGTQLATIKMDWGAVGTLSGDLLLRTTRTTVEAVHLASGALSRLVDRPEQFGPLGRIAVVAPQSTNVPPVPAAPALQPVADDAEIVEPQGEAAVGRLPIDSSSRTEGGRTALVVAAILVTVAALVAMVFLLRRRQA